jgi:hypothetical protein
MMWEHLWNFNHKDFFLGISKNETVNCDRFSHGRVQLHSRGVGGFGCEGKRREEEKEKYGSPLLVEHSIEELIIS